MFLQVLWLKNPWKATGGAAEAGRLEQCLPGRLHALSKHSVLRLLHCLSQASPCCIMCFAHCACTCLQLAHTHAWPSCMRCPSTLCCGCTACHKHRHAASCHAASCHHVLFSLCLHLPCSCCVVSSHLHCHAATPMTSRIPHPCKHHCICSIAAALAA